MRKMISYAQAKKMYPVAYSKLPEKWVTSPDLIFYQDPKGVLTFDTIDGLQYQWTIYGRWMRIT